MTQGLNKFIGIFIAVFFILFIPLESATAAADRQLLAEFSFAAPGAASAQSKPKLKNHGYAMGSNNDCYATAGLFATQSLLSGSINGYENKEPEWSKAEYGASGTDIVPIFEASRKNEWSSNAYIHIKSSTTGFENVRLSMDFTASSKAPKGWKLQFSSNGTDFYWLSGAVISVDYASRKILKTCFSDIVLPGEVSDCATVYFRLVGSTDTTVSGSTINHDSTGGELAINNVRLTGVGIQPKASSAANKPVLTETVNQPSETVAQPVETATAAGQSRTAAGETVTQTGTVRQTIGEVIATLSKNTVDEISTSPATPKGDSSAAYIAIGIAAAVAVAVAVLFVLTKKRRNRQISK